MGSRPAWPAEEIAWAKECFLAGDSLEEIAEAAGRDLVDVRSVLGSGRNLTATEREILSLYSCGCTFAEIDTTRGVINPARLGRAAASCITKLRQKGLPIPHRNATGAWQDAG